MNECAWTTDGRQCAHSDNKINQLFDQWSAATDLSSPEICAWDKFPTTHDSKRTCAKHLAWLNDQINKFLLYDALYLDSQCAKSWKPMLQLTFPWMEWMQIHDMLFALVCRTLHNRHMGTCSWLHRVFGLDFVLKAEALTTFTPQNMMRCQDAACGFF